MATTTRKRSLDFLSKNYVNDLRYKGNSIYRTTGLQSIVGKQETTSEGHQYSLLGKTDLDIGGDFYTRKNTYKDNCPKRFSLLWGDGSVDYKYFYQGVLVPQQTYVLADSNVWPTISKPSDGYLDAKGTTAIARCLPTNPVSGLANFLGELKRDGLPHVPGQETLKSKMKNPPKTGGSEYLNWEFALKPFFSDLQKFAKAVKNGDKIIAQYERDSGKGVRRRYEFPIVESNEELSSVPGSYPGGGLNSYAFASAGVLRKSRTTKTRTWFEGSFTYFLDSGSDYKSRANKALQIANKLFGVRITPELVWNLSPWSWAVDWVSNVGDLAHNVSAFQSDGLVMRYGYIMEETSIIDTYTLDVHLKTGATYNLSQSFGTVSKIRKRATPYGFGLSYDGFSVRQWAIMAALGLSRSWKQAS